MYSLALFLSVDPSLGRVDYRLFSDQTLMEMLLDGLADQTKKRYQDDEGMYLDVCEWSCIECDDDKRVIRIERDSESLTGSIELRYVPPKVKRLVLSSIINGQLIGSVDLTHLPDGMQTLFLDNNQLTGEIDLANFPHGMNELSLKSNKLTGEVELTHLPAGMKGLYLQNNQLTGEIDLTNLPQGMKYLFLQSNYLTGEIDLTHLPERMAGLYLRNIQLLGSLIIKKIPQGMFMIDLGRNHFNDIAVVDSKTHVGVDLKGSGVRSVADGSGREQDMKRFLM